MELVLLLGLWKLGALAARRLDAQLVLLLSLWELGALAARRLGAPLVRLLGLWELGALTATPLAELCHRLAVISTDVPAWTTPRDNG